MDTRANFLMYEMALEQKMVDQHTEDKHLLRLVSQGDEDALTTLYERYGGQLYAYALRIVGERALAEDVLQESLVVIWQRAKTFRGEGRVIAWLFGIVHNKAMRTFREKKNLPLDEISGHPESSGIEPDERLVSEERRKALRSGMEQLSVEHRTVLELVFYQGMTLKETAAVCQVPVGTVKSRLNYAKAALKGALSRQGAALEDLR
jgi:RNA polymerase sigma-70 factor (ECF subfamily)